MRHTSLFAPVHDQSLLLPFLLAAPREREQDMDRTHTGTTQARPVSPSQATPRVAMRSARRATKKPLIPRPPPHLSNHRCRLAHACNHARSPWTVAPNFGRSSAAKCLGPPPWAIGPDPVGRTSKQIGTIPECGYQHELLESYTVQTIGAPRGMIAAARLVWTGRPGNNLIPPMLSCATHQAKQRPAGGA